MGGSSLTGEVLNETFGSKMGFPDMLVLDSTDPGAVKQTLDACNLSRALFVVSSKSGTTTETLAAYSFFRGQVEAAASPRPGMQFVAITDPGRPLDKLATETGFRRTFLNPASIGGRFSALSFFGLVPAAMIGVDIKILLERAHGMVETCGNEVGVRGNPAVQLGAVLAGLARAGRDKVTLVLSEKIRALGSWIEQLLAESLGKDGTGLVPVADEPLGAPDVYGDDRIFVSIVLEGDTTHDAALAKLSDAGHPVLRLTLKDPMDLGAEFFRWELATATAGAVLGVNPFDEPDVARGKEQTSTLLTEWRRSRRLPEWPSDVEEDGLVLMTKSNKKPTSVSKGLAAHLAQAVPGDYLAIQAYLHADAGRVADPPGDPGGPARPAAHRDHGRLGPALPALDGPAAQGRAHERPVHPDHRGRPGRPGHPRRGLRILDSQGRPGAGRSPESARRSAPGHPASPHRQAVPGPAAAPADGPGTDQEALTRMTTPTPTNPAPSSSSAPPAISPSASSSPRSGPCSRAASCPSRSRWSAWRARR